MPVGNNHLPRPPSSQLARCKSTRTQTPRRPRPHASTNFLGNRCHDERSHALLLAPDRDLGCHARLGGERHPDIGHNLAAVDRLAQKLERVRCLVDGHVGALEWL